MAIKKLFKDVIYNTYIKLIPHKNRNPIVEHLKNNTHKNNLVGVEIGVAKGINARCMLENLPIKKLYLVDPYTPFVDKSEITTIYLDDFKRAEKNLEKYTDKILFLKKPFSNSVEDIPNNVDFIYFDACGVYNTVKDFLNEWYPKVKQGGIISGRRFDANYFDNCKAVFDFVKQNNLELQGSNNYWWITKKN